MQGVAFLNVCSLLVLLLCPSRNSGPCASLPFVLSWMFLVTVNVGTGWESGGEKECRAATS